MDNQKQYWKSFEQLTQDPEFLKAQEQEFARDIPVNDIMSEGLTANRRSFLKLFGFSVSAAALAACVKSPVKYAIPYVNKPVNVNPGIADYFASTFYDGTDYAAILVRTREGRPIKLEGNPDFPFSQGALSARGHAAILSLYDVARLQHPVAGNLKISWKDAIAQANQALAGAANIRILTSTIISPTAKKLLAEFKDKYKGAEVVTYDASSASGLIEAHKRSFGKAAVPNIKLHNAELIVSFNADFLGTWIAPAVFTKQYSIARHLSDDAAQNKKMARHVQFETTMSLTGSNADLRIPMKPSQEGLALIKLYNALASKAGKESLPSAGVDLAGNSVSSVANELWAKRGKAVVLSGSNDPNIQQVVVGINQLLGSYGTTLDINAPMTLRQGDDAAVAKLLDELNSGAVDVLIVNNANPVYNYAEGEKFASAIKKAKLSIAFASHENETAEVCKMILPTHNFLESWGDAEPVVGQVSLIQPMINPLFDTQQFEQGLLWMLGNNTNYVDYLRANWKATYGAKAGGDFDKFWVNCLERGFLDYGVAAPADSKEEKAAAAPAAVAAAPAPAAAADAKKDDAPAVGAVVNVADAANAIAASEKGGGMELFLYQKVGIGDGTHANNPWLQELPDPITKICWDNYVCVNKYDADQKGWKDGDLVKVTVGSKSVELPVVVQPGQQRETIAIAVGYGRSEKSGKTSANVGKNVFGFGRVVNGHVINYVAGVKVEATGETYPLASTQTHQTIMGRDIVRETTLDKFLADPKAGNKPSPHLVSLYEGHEYNGHHWGMAIDLSACIGCGACVVSCNAENNVAVVGKEEVIRGREMHWLRIDRYYASSTEDIETAAEQAEVVYMPMMCQHCDSASCENVCPVLATVHGEDGLNQQVYNRCIGTRYCANNCPYKVRRFNWWDYTNKENFPYNPVVEELPRLALNPDVTVRARGVMEKCSFCVQRIQAGKMAAKLAGVPLPDGSVKTACQQACSTGAIKFGDLNDPNSEVAKAFKASRSYVVLEEVKNKPKVAYAVKVRNKTASTQA